MSEVPCDGCRACCSGPNWGLRLDSDDDPSRYTTLERDGEHWVAPSVVHGGCVYLVDGACSIYEDRPNVCRRFDCAALDPRGLKTHLLIARCRRLQRRAA